MRNLVVCCDGTWNTAEQRHDGVPVPTNVVRLYNALAKVNKHGVEQLFYYHPGVGTEPGLLDRVLGGSTGAGLDQNIMSAYSWLCHNYQPGDRIYMYGFSRGAYTVRSLAGLVTNCGLLAPENAKGEETWARITRIFERGYRQRDISSQAETIKDWKKDKWKFHHNGTPNQHKIPIHLVGVWDTVGALGIPNDLALLNLLDANDDHRFHDTNLNPLIINARHAVALDEIRASFQPTLWLDNGSENSSRLKQVWFPGVHCDVGGGYRETGLSDQALLWMIEESQALELAFNPDMISAALHQILPNPRDVLHDSYTDMFKLLPNQPRSIPNLDDTSPANLQRLHPSVLERKKRPPISHAPYRATVGSLAVNKSVEFTIYALRPWNETGLYLEKGHEYEFSATGEWLDRDVSCGPGGTHDGKFQPAEALHLIASAVGEMEAMFKKFTRNKEANFKFTKRHERLNGKRVPWFSLVGAVANGGRANDDGEPSEHETFLIGESCVHSPVASGYFYAYANDAWNFYENNRGSVRLTVKRVK